jgi:hypothetical protein
MKIWKHVLPALALGIAIGITGCKKKDATTDVAPPADQEKVQYCDFEGGPADAPVKVVAYYPGGHEETLAAVKALLEQYPDKVHVQIVDWRREEGRKLRGEAGLSCAGITIDGKNVIEIDRDGKKDSVAFQKGLSKGEWTVADLKTAVDQELAKAGK